jgi:hypothetical protein
MLALTGRFRIYDTGVIVEPGKSRLFTRPRPIGLIQTPRFPIPSPRLHPRPNDLRRVLQARVDPGQSDRLTAGEESSSDSTNSCPPSESGRAAPNTDRIPTCRSNNLSRP